MKVVVLWRSGLAALFILKFVLIFHRNNWVLWGTQQSQVVVVCLEKQKRKKFCSKCFDSYTKSCAFAMRFCSTKYGSIIFNSRRAMCDNISEGWGFLFCLWSLLRGEKAQTECQTHAWKQTILFVISAPLTGESYYSISWYVYSVLKILHCTQKSTRVQVSPDTPPPPNNA